jgi:hypothetical protein
MERCLLEGIHRCLQRSHLQAKIPSKYISEEASRLKLAPRVETYETDTARDSSRKRAQDIHSWVQPLGQSLIATASLVEFTDLILKDSNDGGSRIAGLQLGGERMCGEVFLGLLLIRF